VAGDVQVIGLRETIHKLERLGVSSQDLRTAMGDIAGRVVVEAKAEVNDVTGALGGTVRAGNAKNKAVVRAGGFGVEYAGVNNYGGNGIQATEFLTGPANAHPEENIRAIEADLRRLVAKLNL
jgi:hypothetical protein